MLLDEIHRKREIIARLGNQYGARRVRVFGSVARREERAGDPAHQPGFFVVGEWLTSSLQGMAQESRLAGRLVFAGYFQALLVGAAGVEPATPAV